LFDWKIFALQRKIDESSQSERNRKHNTKMAWQKTRWVPCAQLFDLLAHGLSFVCVLSNLHHFLLQSLELVAAFHGAGEEETYFGDEMVVVLQALDDVVFDHREGGRGLLRQYLDDQERRQEVVAFDVFQHFDDLHLAVFVLFGGKIRQSLDPQVGVVISAEREGLVGEV
jgi:hypothetical protein